MKRHIFYLIIVLFLIGQAGYCQEHVIKATYEKNEIDIPKKGLEQGESFEVNLKGINSILHKVIFKFEDIELVSKAPPGITKIITGIPNSSSFGNPQVLRQQALTLLEEVKYFARMSETIDAYKASAIKILSAKEAPTIEEFKKMRGSWIKNYTTEFSAGMDTTNFISFTQARITAGITFYELLEAQVKNSIQFSQDLTEKVSETKSYYETLTKIESKILSGLQAVEDGTHKKNIKDYASSLPHLPKKDLTAIEIRIVDRFNPTKVIAIKKTDLFVKNKFKIDFSTGLAVNTLVQKEYFFTKTASVNSGIDSERKQDLDLGVVALMHGDWRFTPSFACGPFVGVSLSVLDEKPRYILGLSGSFGKVRSISLNIGANFGRIKTLSKQVSSNGDKYDGSADLAQFESVPLASKIKWGLFIGATYNLTRTRK